MQGNVLGQSGSLSSGLNVYAQLSEPSKKDGVWIKTEETEPINSELEYEQLTSTPNNSSGTTVAIGNDIYLFGSYYSGGGVDTKCAYRYNTLTDTYTQLTEVPYRFNNRPAVAIGTDIYIFGSNENSGTYKYVYKYDTKKNTYTKRRDTPYDFNNISAVVVGTDVYIFGASNTFSGSTLNFFSAVYKYDTITNTYTKLADMPFRTTQIAIAIDTSIYIYGNEGNELQFCAYKYDTITDEYAQIEDTSNEISGSVKVVIDKNIYSFINSTSYKYNTEKNIYTRLTDIPNESDYIATVEIDKNIYLFGSTIVYKVIPVITPTLPEITKYKYDKVELAYNVKNINKNNKTIFIETKQKYKTLLNKVLSIYFSNAYISTDTELLEYPVYYGNGQEWIKI